MRRLAIICLVITGAAILAFSALEIVSRRGDLGWAVPVLLLDIPLAVACLSIAMFASNIRGPVRRLVQILAAVAFPLALFNATSETYRLVSIDIQMSEALQIPLNPHQFTRAALTGIATCAILLVAFIPQRPALQSDLEDSS